MGADEGDSPPAVQIVGKVKMKKTPLSFLESAYQAGSVLAGWDRDELRSTWCPPHRALHEILVG
jgi:hypothetical protein